MIDIYSTRAMLRSLRERKPPKRFLTNMFFSTTDVSTTEYVDIDILKGKRRMAPFVTPIAEGKLVEHERWQTRSYKPPYIKPKMVSKAADLLKRAMGEPINAENLQAKAAMKLVEELDDLRSQVDRRIEWMSAQALNTGQIQVQGEGVNEVIDFQRPAALSVVLSGTDLWSDYSTPSTPVDDVRTWRRLIAQESGLSANTVVMAADVVDAWLNHPTVKDRLNSRRNIAAEVVMEEVPDGATHLGRVDGVDYFAYDEWYEDDTGTEQPMVPNGRVWMGARNARTSVLYGAILDFEALGFSGPIFPKSWLEKDPSVRYVMLQSAPLVAIHQTGGFLDATVL